MQKSYLALFDDTLAPNLTGLIVFLRRQSCIQMEMKTTFPKFVRTQWLSMTQVTVWMKKHCMSVLLYLGEKKPVCMPTVDRWILLLCLNSVATILAETVTCMQGLSTLIYQQLAQFKVLAASLSEMCTVAGPLSSNQLTGIKSGTVVI